MLYILESDNFASLESLNRFLTGIKLLQEVVIKIQAPTTFGIMYISDMCIAYNPAHL